MLELALEETPRAVALAGDSALLLGQRLRAVDLRTKVNTEHNIEARFVATASAGAAYTWAIDGTIHRWMSGSTAKISVFKCPTGFEAIRFTWSGSRLYFLCENSGPPGPVEKIIYFAYAMTTDNLVDEVYSSSRAWASALEPNILTFSPYGDGRVLLDSGQRLVAIGAGQEPRDVTPGAWPPGWIARAAYESKYGIVAIVAPCAGATSVDKCFGRPDLRQPAVLIGGHEAHVLADDAAVVGANGSAAIVVTKTGEILRFHLDKLTEFQQMWQSEGMWRLSMSSRIAVATDGTVAIADAKLLRVWSAR